MTRPSIVKSSTFVTLAALILLAGCGGGGDSASQVDAEPAGSAEAEPAGSADAELAVLEISPEAAAILAKADLADGKEDHVVEKCASCNLAMDGSADYALQAGEYEMHFCSNTCARRFNENADASILGLPQP